MKLAFVQPDTIWEDPAANLEKATGFISKAAVGGAGLAVLPEMFTTGFSMNAHSIKGAESSHEIASLASGNRINILAGVAAASGGRGLNKALAFDSSGAAVSEYTKMHPFSFAGEHEHYSPGPGPVTFELSGVPSSVFICYDLRFPEAFRAVARDVKVIYVLANWPASRQDHWHTLLKARAIENQCYVVGVNRVGTDGNGVQYTGGSAAYGPFGEVPLVCGQEEGVFITELGLKAVDEVRSAYPFLRDMRTD